MSNTTLSEDKLLASTWFSSKQSMEKQQLLCLLESSWELITGDLPP
jgi:predicted DNA-binding protein (MmcQ/YjbR family)